MNMKKFMFCLMVSMLMLTIGHSQTITINQNLFAAGTYRDSSNITVPIDIDVTGTKGFGYNAKTNSVDSNYFILVIVPVANAASPIPDTTTAQIALLGGTKIGRYTFDRNKVANFPMVPYTTFVNGVIPKNFLGAGISSNNYVLKVISVKPFVSSNASAPITIKRTTAPIIKSFAIAGSIGNTTAINYDPTHSAMFFGFCGPIVKPNGTQLDSSISLVDSTAGRFTNLDQTTVYDSVILINNSFHSLVNTNSIVYSGTVSPKGNILFPSGILKAGEYYTLLIKAKDDSGYISSKSYFILNTGWAFNINRTTSASNGCKGDTVSLYPVINNIQAGQQFGIYDNFPGLLYSVTWGDPKTPGALYYSFNQLISNGGVISHLYDTSSCFRPAGSQYWPIAATLSTSFQGSNCAFPVSNQTIQIFSSVKAKFVHPKPICAWNAIDTAGVTIKDSSFAGSNTTCTGNAYYKWYRSFIGCGTINDTTTNPFIYVDSSAVLQGGGVYVPTPVPHKDYKDIYPQPGKYIIKLFADNKQCKTDAYIDSILVEAQPKAKFQFDSLTFKNSSISGCSPLNVVVDNQSDSTCTQKWNFKWEVIDTVTKNVIAPGTIYTIQSPSTNTSTAPVFVFNQQGTYKVRLIGSNACTKQDTAYGIVNVIGNGGVAFPSGNKGVDANRVKINAFCIYQVSKTVNFDTALKTPAIDAVLKPTYGGTPIAGTPYTWTITDIQGTHSFNSATTINSAFPNVTFTTPVNKDGKYFVKVTYSSTCGTSSDSFFLYLNRQVYPKITNPTKDSVTICANTSSLQFDGTVTAADGSNYTSGTVAWSDPSIFGNGLTAFLTNVATKTITFKAFKTQPNGCPDTIFTRKIGVTPYATGRDTTFNVCSGTKLNYNLDSTSKSGNTYIWSANLISGTASGYNNCFTAACGHFIQDLLVGSGTQAQIIYTVTPTGTNGCAGNPFYVTVNILPYPIITLTANPDTLCSGANSHIFVGSSTTGALYNWSYTAPVTLQPIGTQTPSINNIPTNQSGPYLDITFTNTGNTLDSYKVYATLTVANSCSSPTDSITVYVIPGPSQPKANQPRDSIYLCNQSVVNLNANVPSALKGEIGTWSQTQAPYGVFAPADLHKPTAAPVIAPGNVYSFVWSISSPLAISKGCPSLSDSVIVFNRPTITTANAGKDTTLCKYAGNLTSIPLNGNVDLTRPWEVGTWTCLSPNKFQSTGTTTSTKSNDNYVFSGPSGEYDLVWTITNDAGCTATFDTLKIGAGFGNNTIFKDTAICSGGIFNGLTGSLPTGGGGSFTYQWYAPGAVFGANSQDYSPAAPSVTTQYWRTTSSKDCPTANLKSNVVTVTVHPLPQAGLITTVDTSCAPFKLDSTIIRLDTTNFPVDTSTVYSWYVNGTLVATGPKFSVNGLYTIVGQGDSAVVELRDSSKYRCGNVVSIKHTFYTRIKPNPGFITSIPNNTSCNTTSITFTDTTHNPGLYQGWYWDFGQGDVSNTYQPPLPGSYTYNSSPGYDAIYYVKLSAWTACIHDSVTVIDTIKILAKPRASFYAGKYSGCAPLRDTLFNTSIGQVDASTWSWYYPQTPSDSTMININPKQFVIHTFPFTAGVMLKVYNQCGVDSTPVQTIQVAFTAINLKLGLTYSDQYACAPHTSNQLYNAIGANVVDMWTFPIGTPPNTTPDATTNIPAGIVPFTFANPGTYVIKVRASNFCDTVVMYDTVKTFLTPFPQFKLLKDTICVGDTVRPVNLTNTPNVSTFWAFAYSTYIGGPSTTLPNPKTSTQVSPFVVFTNPGRDSIALATTISYPNPSPGYCSDTTKVAYTVVTTQKANMTVSNNNPSCIPATVTFINNSPSSPTPPTAWNFDYHASSVPTATASGTNNPSYTYQDTGLYTVVLDTKSAGGCL